VSRFGSRPPQKRSIDALRKPVNLTRQQHSEGRSAEKRGDKVRVHQSFPLTCRPLTPVARQLEFQFGNLGFRGYYVARHVGDDATRLQNSGLRRQPLARNAGTIAEAYDAIPYASEQGIYFGLAGN
jgi:hypothetical protein